MWFFVRVTVSERAIGAVLTGPQLFYRARYDLPVLLGMRHPWDH